MTHRLTFLCYAAMTTFVFADDNQFKVLEHDAMRIAVPKVKLAMKQAIDTVGKEVPNGRLVEAVLGLKGETPIFEVGFITDAGYTEVTVDADSAKVLGKYNEKPDASEAAEYKARSKAVAAATSTLLQALDLALNEVKGGTAVHASAEIENGKLGYTVDVFDGKNFKDVKVSPDGKVIETVASNDAGQSWIFDREEAGKPPTGWKFGFTNASGGKAQWMVTKDADSPTGPNVLTLSAQSGSGTFNVALVENTTYKDVNLRTRIRPNSGKEDQGGGLIWRAKDENNYYLCRMNPLESNFRVYKVTNGKRDQLQDSTFKAESGKWYVLRAKMVGNHIMCFVGDKKMLDVTDDMLKDAGMIGLWSKADASSSFDNVAVQPAQPNASDSVSKATGSSEKKGNDEDDDDDD
ncbi:MAG: PepSY domain-containing protein [Planctomycetes bacterium]|nr:PepSY domain-containing protein [Planctomycetota bacterium]MBI3834377.1 PepSY domain-containing protein [Planctomycetota bacterium]